MEGWIGSRIGTEMPARFERRPDFGNSALGVGGRDVQPSAEYRDFGKPRNFFERVHGADQVRDFQTQKDGDWTSEFFNSAGVPSAITLPRYMSARRWQYSASSM